MPSRVRVKTKYIPSASASHTPQIKSRYTGYCFTSLNATMPASKRRLHAVDVVADQKAAQFLKDQNQAVGHQHLLQVFTLVEEAEEGPLEHIAEQNREHQADRQRGEEAATEGGDEGASAYAM